ncbi:hypothetical protein [Corynebacterium urogenitale]
MFNLQRFNKEISAALKIFPEEYSGYAVELIASWIVDNQIRVIFQSRNSQRSALWGYKSDQKIENEYAIYSEKEMADYLFFTHIAGDMPALRTLSDGTSIDWRNIPEESEPKTLSEVNKIFEELGSQSKTCALKL